MSNVRRKIKASTLFYLVTLREEGHLYTDQFTSSVRIEILFDTCFTLGWPKIFPSISRVSWKSLRAYVAVVRRHWGSPLTIGGLGFFVGMWKLFVSSCYYFDEVLNVLDGVFSLMVRRWSSATSLRIVSERASKSRLTKKLWR